MRVNVTVALDAGDQLGESPVWDDRREALLRVDITGRRVHAWAPSTGRTEGWDIDGDVGAVVPTDRDDLLLIAVERELRLLGRDGTWTRLACVPGTGDVRFNDCRSDPQGRLWAGTMSRTRTAGAGALYRLDPDGRLANVLEGTTISNGLGWSPDGTTMYFIDSTTQRIDAFDFDGSSGAVSGRRRFASIAPGDGLPDGLTVDAEGGVWVCLFGGGALRRYAADGELAEQVALPVTNPTCPAFMGAGTTTVFVTSARHRLSAAELAREPLAGALLAVDVSATGRAADRVRSRDLIAGYGTRRGDT